MKNIRFISTALAAAVALQLSAPYAASAGENPDILSGNRYYVATTDAGYASYIGSGVSTDTTGATDNTVSGGTNPDTGGAGVGTGTSVTLSESDKTKLQKRMTTLGTNFIDNAISCEMTGTDGTLRNYTLPIDGVRFEMFYTASADAPALAMALGDGSRANSMLLGQRSGENDQFSWVYKKAGTVPEHPDIAVAVLYVWNYGSTVANMQIALGNTTKEFIMTQTSTQTNQSFEAMASMEAEYLDEPLAVCAWYLRKAADQYQNQISDYSNAAALWQIAATGFLISDSKTDYVPDHTPDTVEDKSSFYMMIGNTIIIILAIGAVVLVFIAKKKKDKDADEVHKAKRERLREKLDKKRKNAENDVDGEYSKYADEYTDDDFEDDSEYGDSYYDDGNAEYGDDMNDINSDNGNAEESGNSHAARTNPKTSSNTASKTANNKANSNRTRVNDATRQNNRRPNDAFTNTDTGEDIISDDNGSADMNGGVENDIWNNAMDEDYENSGESGYGENGTGDYGNNNYGIDNYQNNGRYDNGYDGNADNYGDVNNSYNNGYDDSVYIGENTYSDAYNNGNNGIYGGQNRRAACVRNMNVHNSPRQNNTVQNMNSNANGRMNNTMNNGASMIGNTTTNDNVQRNVSGTMNNVNGRTGNRENMNVHNYGVTQGGQPQTQLRGYNMGQRGRNINAQNQNVQIQRNIRGDMGAQGDIRRQPPVQNTQRAQGQRLTQGQRPQGQKPAPVVQGQNGTQMQRRQTQGLMTPQRQVRRPIIQNENAPGVRRQNDGEQGQNRNANTQRMAQRPTQASQQNPAQRPKPAQKPIE